MNIEQSCKGIESTQSHRPEEAIPDSCDKCETSLAAEENVIFKKYKTFSVLIYSYINTSGNWKNEKLCGNTTPAGRSVFTQFRVFPIFTSVDITVYQYGKNVLYFFYNIAQRTLTEKWREIFRVDIELYQHGS